VEVAARLAQEGSSFVPDLRARFGRRSADHLFKRLPTMLQTALHSRASLTKSGQSVVTLGQNMLRRPSSGISFALSPTSRSRVIVYDALEEYHANILLAHLGKHRLAMLRLFSQMLRAFFTGGS
jgi:hypothetical protein